MPTTALLGLRRVAARLAPDPAPDGDLLARFLAHRDEAAFAELVRRHAGMVLGTCRRVLGSAADADDAFQAAFVVLARRAGSLTGRACVGNFLYGVAFHTALKAKAMAARRRTREARATPPEPRPDQSELLAALDEELAKLPDKYREPVVLCELEGRSRREAAGALGVAEGTISSRLATAHRMLGKRLRSRGFAAVAVAALLAGPRPAVADSLTRAAIRSAVAGPPPAVSQLASEVTKMVLLHKLGMGAAALAAGVVMVAAAALVTGEGLPRPVASARAAAAPVPKPAPEPAWKDEFRKAYGLKDGEVVRRVAPPYPECRNEYFRNEVREWHLRIGDKLPEAEAKKDYTNQFVKFGWKGNWPAANPTVRMVGLEPDRGIDVGRLIEVATGLPDYRIEAAPAAGTPVTREPVTGDWVVRVGAEPEKVAAALETILRGECGLNLALAVKEDERDVFVLSGKYAAKPLPGSGNEIEIYARELTDRNGGGGGTGDLGLMAERVEDHIDFPIVLGRVEGAPKQVTWHYNYRLKATDEQRKEDRDPEAVMKNLTAQTGLTATKEKRKIKVLEVKKVP
jgi:RNA polymerase sigma factor (sigma-70 family)